MPSRISLLGRLRVVLQQVDRRHDHARRAVAALQAVLFPEALLQRVQLAVRRQPFDGRDRRAVGLHREHRAGLRAAAVDEHRAGAALARVAADVRAGEAEMLAQEVHEQQARLDVALRDLAVDRHRDLSHACVSSVSKRHSLPQNAHCPNHEDTKDTKGTRRRKRSSSCYLRVLRVFVVRVAIASRRRRRRRRFRARGTSCAPAGRTRRGRSPCRARRA